MITKLKNILRCYATGMGINETANTFHISRNTVRKYVRLSLSSGKTTDQLLALSEEHLREMFGCNEFRHREPSQRQLELDALMPDYVARLSRKGMTVRKLFQEYRSEHPDGFQESAFKRAVRQYRVHSKVVGHVEHYAADQM
ncbi:MAG: helix-turn-helix domain-containing protein [Muribaculum sp.]|nr:helix-turn-helix domain-containing protein [Muribaculum sp.]